MELYNKDFWSAESFSEAFRKVTQFRFSQKEKYLRSTYISYQKLINTIRKHQSYARKLLDYGSGFGMGWLLGTMEGFDVHCADIGDLLDFPPARKKYKLPEDLKKIKRMKWDAVYLVGVLSYIPQKDVDEFIDSLLEFRTKGLYLMGWCEGKYKRMYNRHGVKGHVYERKELIPLFRKKKFKIIDKIYPFVCLVR